MLAVKLILAALCTLVSSNETEQHANIPDNKLYTLLVQKLDHLERQWQEDKQQWQNDKQQWQQENQQWQQQWQQKWRQEQQRQQKWQQEKQQWQQEKLQLWDEITELKSRCRYEEAEQRLPRPRSDDTNALEPVVSQMGQRLNELGAEVEALKNSDSQQASDIRQAGTSTFVRWGSSSCPNSTELVYSGFVGGNGNYDSLGAGTSVHCLPFNPVLVSHTLPSHRADLYGGEYQTYLDSHNDKDPTCAVCRTSRPTNIMVPATNRCENGWTLEYTGYLMGSSTQYAGGHDSVCMDSKLEERAGSETSTTALLFYYTYTVCSGSLPCPPYVNGKLVLCVVCSK